MATTLISEPSGILSLGECAKYSFQGTPKAGAIVTKIAYQWENVTDGVLGPIEIADSEGEVTIDFTKDFRSQLETQVPIGVNIITDLTAIKEFRIKFGEQVNDTENCSSNVSLGGQTSTIQVYRGWPHYFDDFSSGTRVLSSRPDRYCSCGDDFVTILSDVSGIITITNNGSQAVLQEGFDAGITHLNVDPASFPVPSNGATEYTIALTGSDRTFTVYKGNCCECSVPIDVLILESNGGWSSLRLCLESVSGSRERNSFKFDDCLIAGADFQNAGLYVQNNDRTTELTLRGKALSDEGNMRWLVSLNQAIEAFIKLPKIGGGYEWMKGQINGASPAYEEGQILNYNLSIQI
jgi:hypothetical protein